jgi:hypothetical protein
LFFTFSFVNDATASSLESRDSQNEVVALICGSVMDQVSHQGVKWTLLMFSGASQATKLNKRVTIWNSSQAAGTDVKLAAIGQGVIFQTDSTIGDCQIIAAHRINVGRVSGLFTLELQFRLSVFASTSDVALLAQFIAVGFSASSGGRATFLNRLTTGNDYFDDLQDADILVAGRFTSGPPTRSPSSPPTFKPTPTIVPATEALDPRFDYKPDKESNFRSIIKPNCICIIKSDNNDNNTGTIFDTVIQWILHSN